MISDGWENVDIGTDRNAQDERIRQLYQSPEHPTYDAIAETLGVSRALVNRRLTQMFKHEGLTPRTPWRRGGRKMRTTKGSYKDGCRERDAK